VDRKFLSGVEYEGKTGVVYKVSREFARRQKALELSGDPKEIFAIEGLIREGIDGAVARELVVTHGPEKCLFYADAVNHQRGVGSRPGWIIAAIREGWTVRGAATLQGPLLGSSGDLSITDTESEERSIPSPPPESDPAAAEIWASVLGDLSAGDDESPEGVAPTSLMVWFEGTVPLALEDEVLTVLVPNSFAQEYIEMRFSDLLEASLKEYLSKGATLRLTTAPP
jgi:DnaA N-terminal domain